MLGTPGCHHDAAKPTAPIAEAPVEATSPVEAAPPVEDAAPVEEPPVVVAPAAVRVQIMSKPDGAQIYREGILAGTTPLMMEVAASDEPLILRVILEGYDAKQLTIKPSEDQVLALTLVKAARVRGTTGKKTGRGFILS